MASFIEFVALVDKTLMELKIKEPESQSQEWYAINHLSQLSLNCHASKSAKEVKNSVKSVMHFAVDSLDWDSELGKKFIHLSEYHAGLLKVGM